MIKPATCALFFLLCFTACLSQKKDFARQIKNGEAIVVENETFDKAIDLTSLGEKIYQGDNEYRVFINSPLVFRHCIFKKGMIGAATDGKQNSIYVSILRNVVFEDCRFNGICNLRGISVTGKVSFVKSMFDSAFIMEDANCAGAVTMEQAVFTEPCRMQNAVFHMNASFLNASFLDKTSFQGAWFKMAANFSNAQFRQYADFGMTHFGGGAFFNYNTFSGTTTFNYARFYDRMECMNTKASHIEVKNARYYEAPKFTGTKLTAQIDFTGTIFSGGKPDITGLSGEAIGL